MPSTRPPVRWPSSWSDCDRIANQWDAPGADLRYLERTWLNRIKQSSEQAFDIPRWNELADPDHVVPIADAEAGTAGALIVLGFHGARYWDAVALIATEVATGFQWPVGIWQRPPDAAGWEADSDEVEGSVAEAFERYQVWKFYVNPDRWESSAASWVNLYGEDRVLAWRTNAWTHMSRAVRAFTEAIRAGELHHDGNDLFAAHIGAARQRYLSIRDEDGSRVWVPVKERPDSPFPINAAQAGIISWQARLDALKTGAMEPVIWTAA